MLPERKNENGQSYFIGDANKALLIFAINIDL